MAAELETKVRGPEAYALARQVLGEMEAVGIWPTPVNFELWLHYVGDPEGPLGREIRRLLAAEDPFTEATSEMLASTYLPRGRLSDEIRDAGRILDKELSVVASTIAQAHRSQVEYGVTLADASANMEGVEGTETLKALVSGLADATRKAHEQNSELETQLATSTREVAKLREHLEQVRRDAMTDALTTLANRKAFDERLDSSVEAAHEAGKDLTLAVIDIDHFKRFNDTWGHQTGDQVLRYVASVLGRVARAPRMAARYGGEEFALIFPDESAADVEKTLNTALKEIASRSLRRRSTNDELGAVTISAGFARLRAGEASASLLERADAALYASKRAGRNRVTDADHLEQAA